MKKVVRKKKTRKKSPSIHLSEQVHMDDWRKFRNVFFLVFVITIITVFILSYIEGSKVDPSLSPRDSIRKTSFVEQFDVNLPLSTVESGEFELKIDLDVFTFIEGSTKEVGGEYAHQIRRGFVETTDGKGNGGNYPAQMIIRKGSYLITFQTDNYFYSIYPKEKSRTGNDAIIEKQILGEVNFEGDIIEDSFGKFGGLEDISFEGVGGGTQELGAGWVGDDGSVAEIIAFYSPAYRIAKGGTTNVINRILSDVALVNAIRQDSNIFSQVSVVHFEELPGYVEPAGDSDGNLGEQVPGYGNTYVYYMYDLRTQHNADIQAAWFDDWLRPGICGLGSLPGGSVKVHHSGSCGITGYVLAHEIGHNFGCHHQISNAPEGGEPFVYGRGYVNSFATVMYASASSSHDLYSNPDLDYFGYPIGIEEGLPGEADCAKNNDQMRYTISNLGVSCPTCEILPANPPTSLQALYVNPSQVELTWDESSTPGVYRYKIYRSSISGMACQESDLIYESPAFNSYIDTGVGIGDYYYSMKSVIVKHPHYLDIQNPEFLEGDCSEVVQTTSTALDAPQNLVASDGTSNSAITVSWSPVLNAESYDLYRSTTPIACRDFLKNTGATLDVDSSVGFNEKYYYSVKAKNSFGESPCSNVDVGFTSYQDVDFGPLPAPGVPGNIYATDGDFGDQVLVSWDAATGPVSLYEVFRDDTTCSGTPLSSTGFFQNYFYDTSVIPDVVYDYSVRARGGDGDSACSSFDSGYADSGNIVNCEIYGDGSHVDVGGGLCEATYYVRDDGFVQHFGLGSWQEVHDDVAGFNAYNSPNVYVYIASLTYDNPSHFIYRGFYSFDWDLPIGATLASATFSLKPQYISEGAPGDSIVFFKSDATFPLDISDYQNTCDTTVGAANMNNALAEKAFSSFSVDSYTDISLDILKVPTAVSGNEIRFCIRDGSEARNIPPIIEAGGPIFRPYSRDNGNGPILKVQYRP